MIKKVVVFTIAFVVLFGVLFFLQNLVINKSSQILRFNVYDTNMFYAVSSLIICIHFEIFSHIKSLQPQLGFIYLPTLFIKGILFFVVFKSSIFNQETLTIHERLHLLIPLLLFLILEVFFITQILKENQLD
ncbi:DUF6168 family protein [Psychroserpens damuponensis]|uniref:DUF6168 family protein n=1 Tax=Psychroserpens damuponensis TaxID=943936 RepID=UPI00058BB8F9|nr:DUF6168 family protein [Psychroserpens damuponensis]